MTPSNPHPNPTALPDPTASPDLTSLLDPTSPPAPKARPNSTSPLAPTSPPDPTTPLDTTAQLITRITSELGTRLGRVTLNGSRRTDPGRTPVPTFPAPTPHAAPLAGRPTPTSTPILVLVAHGSRDPRAHRTVTALVDLVRALRPGLDVRLGHIELNEPALDETLRGLPADGPGAVLVPLLLSRGYHVKHDIPAAVAAAAAAAASAAPTATAPPPPGGAPLHLAAPLGPHPLLIEALHARLTEAGWPAGPAPEGHGVVLAAAGSRDPDSAVDTRRAAGLLARRLGVPVVPAYAAPTEHTPTTVPAALRALAARGVRHAAVASYFTAPGRFATQVADAAPWLTAAPLGAHPALAALLLHRYDQARSAAPTPHRQLASA